jgi:hypothetical protein
VSWCLIEKERKGRERRGRRKIRELEKVEDKNYMARRKITFGNKPHDKTKQEKHITGNVLCPCRIRNCRKSSNRRYQFSNASLARGFCVCSNSSAVGTTAGRCKS